MIQAPMRDPLGNAEAYSRYLQSSQGAPWPAEEFDAYPLHSQVSIQASYLRSWPNYAVHLYGSGAPLDALQSWILERTDGLEAARSFLETRDSAEIRDGNLIGGNRRTGALGFVALALLAVDAPGFPARLSALMSPAAERRNYLVDLCIKSFDPAFKMAKKYKSDKYAAPWTDPVLRALALPPDARAPALAAHMKNWCRLLKPWGYKPNLDATVGKDNLFCEFAYEVALAVCAFDIDDSSFDGHPFYPRDLVAAYRGRLRDTRDAWRARQAGPGFEVVAPPPPALADLAKSKRKNAARWIELVCDGNADATEAVLDAIGAVRKFKECDTLLSALQEEGQAIHADIKDDDTVELQADGIAGARGLGQFDGPPPPPAGPARCGAVLRSFDAFLAAKGYRLAAIDLDDDAWHAVAVRAGYHEELLALGAALGIPARNPAEAYAG